MIVAKTENGVTTEKTIFAKDLNTYARQEQKVDQKKEKAPKKIKKKKNSSDDLEFESFGKKRK